MGSPRLLRTLKGREVVSSRRLGRPRPGLAGLVHLLDMLNSHAEIATQQDAMTDADTPDVPVSAVIEGVLTLSELCALLGVSTQTIYDLRCQGRGPRGFRVGRQLRFRASEIDAWLAD